MNPYFFSDKTYIFIKMMSDLRIKSFVWFCSVFFIFNLNFHLTFLAMSLNFFKAFFLEGKRSGRRGNMIFVFNIFWRCIQLSVSYMFSWIFNYTNFIFFLLDFSLEICITRLSKYVHYSNFTFTIPSHVS